jgi:CRP/FNR family transcriptional regulator
MARSELARRPSDLHYPEERLFGNLSPEALKQLASISLPTRYSKGAVLFVEGEAPRGIFIVRSGRVKLSTSSPEGKKIIVRFVEAGRVVGLPGTISGRPYAVTAEIAERTEADFIPRQAFLHFLREHGEAALRVAQLMGEVVHATYDEVRSLGLSRSTEEKLATFLLDWWDRHLKKRGPQRVKLTLTQEEIAEAIGATRETVTRLLADIRRRKVIEIEGANLTIVDRAALENMIGTRPRT